MDEITYLDTEGIQQILDPAEYRVTSLNRNDAVIRPAEGKQFPSTQQDTEEAVSVTYTSGYGDDPEDVPAPIRQAILMDIGHLYENRETMVMGTLQPVPMGYDTLISNYRLWSF